MSTLVAAALTFTAGPLGDEPTCRTTGDGLAALTALAVDVYLY